MIIHNRQIKAAFWSDPDLLQWARDKRWFYEGLCQLADDSGCLEDSPFAFKLHLFPSPIDADITVEIISAWLEEMVQQKKLIRYEVQGKKCLYLVNFHKHQSLRSPGKPEVPLPTWIVYTSSKGKGGGSYNVGNPFEDANSSYEIRTNNVPPSYDQQIEEEEEREVEEKVEEEGVTEIASAASSNSLNIYSFYTHCGFGTLSGSSKERLDALVDDYSEQWVRYALTEGDKYGKRSFAYIERILGDWRTSGGLKKTLANTNKPAQKTTAEEFLARRRAKADDG